VSDTVPAISPTSPTIYDATVRNRSLAVFAQGIWEFVPSWRLTAGARYSEDRRVLISANSNRTNTCVVPAPGVTVITAAPSSRQCPRKFEDSSSDPSWLLSLDHEFSQDVLAYAKYATGYRSGGRNFKGSGNIGTFIGFDPETVTEYEVGLKSYFLDRKIRFNLAVYYDDYQDVQKVATITLPGTTALSSQTVNAAKASVQGVEADVIWRVTDDFTLNGAAGLVDGEYKRFVDLTGDRSNEPFDVPEWTFNVGGRYVMPTAVGDLGLQVDYQWQDEYYLDPQAYDVVDFVQPSRGLLGARVSLEVEDWNAQFALVGKNLTDKEYLASGASPYKSLGFNFAVVGEPRTVGLEFVKRFGNQ
jgi:iron complex outermembrane receptor protein